MGRLGSKNPNLPEVREASYQPVLNMGNLDFLQSEPFEARAIATVIVQGVGFRFATFELRCAGPGGAVIETIALQFTGNPGDLLVRRAGEPILVPTGAAVQAVPVQVGGVAARSRFIGDTQTNAEFPDLTGAPRLLVPGEDVAGNETRLLEDLRLFVPPGDVIAFQLAGGAAAGASLTLSLKWRELGEPIG